MSNREATLILKIKEAGSQAIDKVAAALNKVSGQAKSLGSVLGGQFTQAVGKVRSAFAAVAERAKSFGDALKDHFVVTAGDVINGIKEIGRSVLDFVQQASQFDNVSTAFENLARSQGQDANEMLANMRKLTQGTITDMELMKQANQAMLLGLPVERFDEMLQIARASAKSTGQSMDFMLNSIVTGLGRGSKLMLDNLGILVDADKANQKYAASLGKTAEQLTDNERKQAFINEALRIGSANAEATGVTQLSLADKMQQLNVRAQNLAITIGQKLTPVFEFFTEQSLESTGSIEQWIQKSQSLEGALVFITKSVAVLTNFVQLMSAEWSAFFGGALESAKKLIELDFSGFVKARVDQFKDMGKAIPEQWEKMQSDLERIDEIFAQRRLDRAASNDQALASQRQAKAEEERAAKESKYVEEEILRQERAANEISQINATESQKLALEIEFLDKKLKEATTNAEKMRILKDREALLVKLRGIAEQEAERKKNEEIARNRQDTLSKIAIMQSANNQVLATIGKAAALTQIAIDTPVAVGKALAAFPPPFNFAAAGAVSAAMAVQAARVAGVPLAEGGIVRATHGGVPAIIGEGGRDEAVIPLDDPDARARLGGGGGVTINVYGGVLGDRSSAREFAVAVDRELLRLRQNNESLAFDQGLV